MKCQVTKMLKCRVLHTGERRGSYLCFVAGMHAHKGIDMGLISKQA